MLMVFLIQNSQNRDNSAVPLKLDELLRAGQETKNAFINLEELTEEDLRRIKERYAALAKTARQEGDKSAIEPSGGLAVLLRRLHV